MNCAMSCSQVGKLWLEEDRELYVRMKSVLEKTRKYLDTALDARERPPHSGPVLRLNYFMAYPCSE
jgi:hypothetical protein